MTLRATCERLTPQVWYNQRITSASHFWAQRGERVHKPDIIGKNAKAEYVMTVEDYMSVSKISMRFYIATKLQLHYIELSIAFSGYPRLGRAACRGMGGDG
jgi:hypothetical protein